MADFYTIKPEVATSAGGQLREKQHDNGDGTSSPTVFIEGGNITLSSEVEIKNDLGNPVPVLADSLPLPNGASTAANQVIGNTSLDAIDAKLGDQATAANQTTSNTSLASIDTKLSSQATVANQTAANASLGSIDGKLTDVATATRQDIGNISLISIDSKLTGVSTAANQANLNGAIGTAVDAPATSDTGAFSLIALFKRMLTKMAFVFDTLSGGLKVQEQYVPGYEDNDKKRALVQRPGFPFTITAAGTVSPLVGPYHINSIRVLGGTLGNVTIYDAASVTGTPIVPAFTPVQGQVILEDIDVINGLTIVTASATIVLVSYGY